MELDPKISMETIREMFEDIFTIDYECNYCKNRVKKEKPSTSQRPKPKSRKSKENRVDSQYVCFFCGQLGHIKRNCVRYQNYEKSKIKTYVPKST